MDPVRPGTSSRHPGADSCRGRIRRILLRPGLNEYVSADGLSGALYQGGAAPVPAGACDCPPTLCAAQDA